ncbi:MAG TPA: DUF1080 domain-containing protein, partial [Chitinophagaceae bacterium]|nr:DUF1080 domain-containing protein [Chitinophagaceae bacterium]
MKKNILFCLLLLPVLALHAQNGWQNLFDGKTLSGWKQAAGKALYKVEDGAITGYTVVQSPNSFLVTEKEYGDFILELEVKIDDSTSNSGIQLRSHIINGSV